MKKRGRPRKDPQPSGDSGNGSSNSTKSSSNSSNSNSNSNNQMSQNAARHPLNKKHAVTAGVRESVCAQGEEQPMLPQGRRRTLRRTRAKLFTVQQLMMEDNERIRANGSGSGLYGSSSSGSGLYGSSSSGSGLDSNSSSSSGSEKKKDGDGGEKLKRSKQSPRLCEVNQDHSSTTSSFRLYDWESTTAASMEAVNRPIVAMQQQQHCEQSHNRMESQCAEVIVCQQPHTIQYQHCNPLTFPIVMRNEMSAAPAADAPINNTSQQRHVFPREVLPSFKMLLQSLNYCQ